MNDETTAPPKPSSGNSPGEDKNQWLSSEQAASVMGLRPNRFRDIASQMSLPRRKQGIRVYYETAVIEAAKAQLKADEAAKARTARSKAARATAPTEPTATAKPKDALLEQALTMMQAQIATTDRLIRALTQRG